MRTITQLLCLSSYFTCILDSETQSLRTTSLWWSTFGRDCILGCMSTPKISDCRFWPWTALLPHLRTEVRGPDTLSLEMGKYIIFTLTWGSNAGTSITLNSFWLYYMKQFNFTHFSTNRFPKTTEDFQRLPKIFEEKSENFPLHIRHYTCERYIFTVYRDDFFT